MSEIGVLWDYLNAIMRDGEITLGLWDMNLPMNMKSLMDKIYGHVRSVTLCEVSLSAQPEEQTILMTGTCPSVFCKEIVDQTEVRITMKDTGSGNGWGSVWHIVWRNVYAGGGGGIRWLDRWPGNPTMQVREGLFVHSASVLEGSVVVSYEYTAVSESAWKPSGHIVKVVLDMAETELYKRYLLFFGEDSNMVFTAELSANDWNNDGITAAFISDAFERSFVFPVFAQETGEPEPACSTEMRVVIKTAVYDQMSVANWADDKNGELLSAAWFVFELEAPERHGFSSLSMEAFSEDESGCIDFYAEKGKFREDENGRIEVYAEDDHPWDTALVTEVFGPELANEVDKQIQETGEVLPSVARLLSLRGAAEVCNLTFRFGFGEDPREFIRQNFFLDIRLGSRGEDIFAGMARQFHTSMDLASIFFHFEIVFREEGAAVCCSVRSLAELQGDSSLFYDSSGGDFSLCWRPEPRPLSEFGFPDMDFDFEKTETVSADSGEIVDDSSLSDAGKTVEDSSLVDAGETAGDIDLRVEDFALQGNFRERNVYAALSLSMNNILKLSIGSLQLELKEITAYISIQEQDMGFGIEGLAQIALTAEERAALSMADDIDRFALSVGGTYEQSRWSMYASLAYGRISLAGLIRRIAGIQIPEGYDLQITKLSIYFQSGTGYQAVCELDGTIPVLDMELVVGAEITDLKPQPRKVQLYGQLSLLGFLFTARVQLGESTSRLFFELTFDGADLIAEAEGNQVVITIREISVGALIRAFYRVIRPNVDYSLPDPWSLLNKIDLSDVVITFDKEKKIVTVVKELHINLLVAQVTGIGFQYVWGEQDPDKDRFEIILRTNEKSGEMLPERDSLWDNGEDGPLQGFRWDALHDNAPVLFQGGEVFALHYFALGRNVFLGEVERDGRLRDILAQLRRNLSDQGAGYDPETGWMICADFTIAKCLSLCILIYDPWIYGAQITVESDSIAGLKGLDLTLYYRKVTDAIGVFYLHAQLPDAIRKVDLGGISFTLPVIEVWLYTNGDFKVNLGFPENRDFSRSFAFSYGIYSGSGGLYFGKLSGDTSSKVPAIVNGYFTPVVEIGIGLKFGVGKSFDFGILKLKARLEIMGIFEGVFAVFRSKDERQEEAFYYKCTALVEVSAELSGTVDFFVIKAGFHIFARVQVMVTLEAHEPALIGFEAELSVEAYLKILFVTVEFSFSFTYRDQFILGEKSVAPWVIEQDNALPIQVMAQVMNRRADTGLRDSLRGEMLSWDARDPFETPEGLTCLAAPYFTAKQILLKEKETGQDAPRKGKYAEKADGWQTVILSALTEASFTALVKGLARRAMYAASGGEDRVTLGQLYELKGTLEEARSTVFRMDILEKFMQSAFRVNLCVPGRENWDGQMEGGAVIPLFPQLVLTWYAREAEELVPVTQVELMENHPLSETQIAEIRDYFAHFEAEAEQADLRQRNRMEAGQTDSAQGDRQEAGQSDSGQGAAAIVFEDYCFMLTRQCVLDVIRRLEEETGVVTAIEVEEALGRAYLVMELSDALPFAQYRGMGNRFLLGGARLPLAAEAETSESAEGIGLAEETEPGSQTVFWPLYELMGVMFDSVAEETAGIGAEPVHRLVITKNAACDCSWIDFAYSGFQEERLYVIQREEYINAEDIEETLVLDILKKELEYPDQELKVSFARKPAQLPNVRLQKIPLPLRAGRRLYHDGGEAELWKLPLSMAELGADVRLGFGGQGNLVKGVENTVDYVLGVTLSFELLKQESYVNCISINKVPEETLALLQQAREYTWDHAALLLPSPVQDNHGTDPITDTVRNQALSLLRCNLSQRTRPAGERVQTARPNREIQMETLASIENLQAFLSLLFDMGQVGGKGQFLIFGQNPPDASYYEEDGICRVELLLTCTKKQRRDCINALIFQRPEGAAGEPLLCGEGIPSRPLVVMKQGVAGFSFSLRDPDFEKGIAEKEKRTRQAFSLLNYRKEEDAVLGGAYDSMPVSMQKGAEGEWEYRAALAVYRFGEKAAGDGLPPVTENPYKGVLESGQLNLSLFFTDVCGNPALDADGSGLPVSLDLLYTDELIGISAWPDTSCSYQILPTGNGKLLFRFLVDFGDDNTTNPKKILLRGEENRPDRERCALIYYQLHQPDTRLALRFTLSGEEEIRPGEDLRSLLREYSGRLYEYACGGSIPEEIRYEIELPEAPASKRPRLVRAQLTISRDESRVQKDAPLPMGVRAVSEIPPYQDFALFCEQFENAFDKAAFCVKLAKGTKGLYAIYFGEGGCRLQAGIAETPCGLFAQRPISLSLINREKVNVIHLDDSVEERSFYGVDINLWLSGFLQDMENILSPHRLEKLVADRDCLEILSVLSKTKRSLAQAIPEKTSGLFEEADQGLTEDVKYALCEELAEDLSRASRIAGIMAYRNKNAEDTMNFILSSQRADVGLQKLERGRAVVVFAMPENQKAVKQVELSGTDAVFTHAELPGEGWFSFVRPFHTVELYGRMTLEQDERGNPVSVPVILREYPDTPVLMNHQGDMDDGTMLSAFTWDYLARMRLKPAAQDRIYIALVINNGNLAAARNREEDLFSVLAGYDTVREEILAALEEPSMRQKALRYFQELALAVLRHLNAETVEQALVRETLLLQAVYDGGRIGRYVLQRQPGQSITGGFPVLTVTDPAGNRAVMRPEEETGDRAVYSLEAFPQVHVDFKEEAEYELLFEKLSLKQIQGMSIEAACTRNEAFSLPGYGDKKVLPAFVYRTETVSFPQMVSPLGSYEKEVEAGAFSRDSFCNLLEEVSKYFKLQIAVYLEQILYESAGIPPVTADFPICLGIKRSMGREELLAFCDVIEEWLADLQQRSGTERIRVSLQCYSKDLEQERLLLEWKNIVFVLR